MNDSSVSPTLIDRLGRILDSADILERPIERVAYASDASFYHLIPQVVVRPRNLSQIRGLFQLSREVRIPLTFRAAGTSLSGQSITDGILVDISRHWRETFQDADHRIVHVQPGIIGARVNGTLAPFGRRIGPDPASINACMMGGILANNASGMCCGITQNAYQTLKSMVLVLPDGTVLDTGKPGNESRFLEDAPHVVEGLEDLRDRVRSQPDLVALIRNKYTLKNTVGYALNSFLDHDELGQILSHLMIGSEGTLGFIAGASLRTVPDPPHKLTIWLTCNTVEDACLAVDWARELGAAACELLDHASLQAVAHLPGTPISDQSLPRGATGLLIEFQCETERMRSDLEVMMRKELERLRLLSKPMITRDPEEQARIWTLRKGLFTSVGAVRAPGTTVIIEDISVPKPRLARAIRDLESLFDRHGYEPGIVFGHAKDGNLHFVVTQSFSEEKQISKYSAFMKDLVDMVLNEHGGALKAEHGTGRNMAPFVRMEWGEDAYLIMTEVKKLLDPDSILNPGVILNSNTRAHVENLKTLPEVEASIDPCIECGFCEKTCPSRDLSLTPRQRIVVQRHLTRRSSPHWSAELDTQIESDYPYEAVDTCAVDGLCALSCPVGIDTGAMMRRTRGLRHGKVSSWIARLAVTFPRGFEWAGGSALRAGHLASRIVGSRRMESFCRGLLRWLERWSRGLLRGRGIRVPAWIDPMPYKAPRVLKAASPANPVATFWPSCPGRIFASSPDPERTPGQLLQTLALRADRPLRVPGSVAGSCCGLALRSKGFERFADEMVKKTLDRLFIETEAGKLPIVTDNSSCAAELVKFIESLPGADARKTLRVTDLPRFIEEEMLHRLTIVPVPGPVVIHPPCSMVRAGEARQLERLAKACATSVTVPRDLSCCGFAGDRGFMLPELTMSATRDEAHEVVSRSATGHYSCNVTCEIGMSRSTGQPYTSILDLVERASRPPDEDSDFVAASQV